MSKSISGTKVLLGSLLVVIPVTLGVLWHQSKSTTTQKRSPESKTAKLPARRRQIKILYGTVTGTARSFAKHLLLKINSLKNENIEASVMDIEEYNEDDLVKEDIVLLISSTWTDGTAPEKCGMFFEHLKDFAFDFRVSKDHYSSLTFSCFGLGSAYYGDNYAKAAYDAHGYLEHLGATALAPVARGDDQSDLEDRFVEWADETVVLVAGLTNCSAARAIKGSIKMDESGPKHKNPVLTETEKADLLKQRKQSKMDKKSHIGRGNSFQQQQLALGVGKSAKAGKGTKNGNGSGGGVSVEDKDTESVVGEDEEEEEDRINNTFVAINDIDVEEHKHTEGSSCCSSSSGSSEGKTGDSNGGGCCSTKKSGGSKDKQAQSKDESGTNPNLLPPIDGDSDDEEEDAADALHQKEKDGTLDMEDLGATIQINQERTARENDGVKREPSAMVTKLQRKALTKEGYRIIGTHSAVKLCRWTKNQMRGRGGCYKHTFYGITSYQCMEATPSLACASKCVFCWRHHKNPVGTEWRWKEDDPVYIVKEAVELHQGMINEMRGVPGVVPERLAEGYQVKHCALSLVGEPIMYPRINEMLQELHNRGISTFMVTNAQFPEEVKALDPVTQLYVSVDAATRDSLKAIDRPLFRDFWERFQGALENMKDKKQRTVYRLTLVSGWNMTEVDAYAQLVEVGTPDFIEIKAVTYCGKSDASSLTMENVPWHK
jgi:wyosine [tRNA(Phe)-imidazoG37] synthetase (radical SAM superfamily)/flavodoxin